MKSDTFKSGNDLPKSPKLLPLYSMQSSPKKKLDKSNKRCIIKVQSNEGGVKVMGERRNFYLTDLQLKRLNSMSKKLGLSASEILRRAIDEYWERFERKEKRK